MMFGLLTAVMLFLPSPAAADAQPDAVIENIKLANTRDDLLTYFDVKNAFTEKINQAVLNGVPTTFSFYVTLYHTDDSWFDKKIADIQVKSTLKYNPLKKEFLVQRPWKEDSPFVAASFEEAKAAMTEIDNLTIIALNQLIKGNKYQLRIKAELDKVTLPLSLHHILFFLSFWDFETNWYLINFTY
jgi:hypothetical protein